MCDARKVWEVLVLTPALDASAETGQKHTSAVQGTTSAISSEL